MQPNQEPQLLPQEQRIDTTYLDTIATPQTQHTLNPKLLWGLIFGGLLLVGVFLMMLFSSGGPSNSERMTSFLYRVQSLKGLVDTSTDTLKSSQLVAANASLSSILTGIQSETAASVKSGKEKVASKPPKGSAILTEYEEINQKLETARLNVSFDRTYAREVAYQITKLRTEMVPIYEDSSSKELRNFLETADEDLKNLNVDIKKFD